MHEVVIVDLQSSWVAAVTVLVVIVIVCRLREIRIRIG